MEKSNLREKVGKSLGRWKFQIVFTGIVALIFTIACVRFFSGLQASDLEFYNQTAATLGRYGDLGTFVGLFIGNTIIPFPTDAYFASAMKLSSRPMRIFVIGVLAAFLGGLANYFLADFLGSKWVERKIGRKGMLEAKEFFDSYGPFAFILFAILPLPFFDPLTFFAGLSKMELKQFSLFTLIAKIIHYSLWSLVPMRLF